MSNTLLTFTGTRLRDGAEVRLVARESCDVDHVGRPLYGMALTCAPPGGRRYTVARVTGFRPGLVCAGEDWRRAAGGAAVFLLWYVVTHTEDDRVREDVGDVRPGVARFLFECGRVSASGAVPYMGDAMDECVRWEFDEEEG